MISCMVSQYGFTRFHFIGLADTGFDDSIHRRIVCSFSFKELVKRPRLWREVDRPDHFVRDLAPGRSDLRDVDVFSFVERAAGVFFLDFGLVNWPT